MNMLNKFFRIFIALLISVCVISSSFVSIAVFATNPPEIEVEGGTPEEGGLGGDNEGNTGDTGDSGESGDSGDTGDSGDSGNNGDAGNNGDTGNSGDAGNSGNSGNTGNTGNSGNTENNRPVVNTPVEDDEEEETAEEEETEEEETTEEDDTLEEGQFRVYIELNGGVMQNVELEPGETYSIIIMDGPECISFVDQDPTKEGYIFGGWYSDPSFTVEWDCEEIISEERTIYAKWDVDASTILYNITVTSGKGGKITVKPERAAAGETVLIMIQSEEGMRLKKGSLLINDEPSESLSFVMPAGDVTIHAEFEEAPVDKKDDSNTAMILVAVLAVLVIGGLVVFIVIKRRNSAIIVPEFDENGAIIINDDEEVWIDETIVIESGFKNGKKKTEGNPPEKEEVENTISIEDLMNNK